MTIENGHVANGKPLLLPRPSVVEARAMANLNGHTIASELSADKLTIRLTDAPKPLPAPESLLFGQAMTDHMLTASFDPATGWGAPEIKPYGPLSLDPASSCFQYCPNVFEGMKAYLGPDGKARLFRPNLNMERLVRSADRVALPPFDSAELLKLIQKLIAVDQRWIPRLPGYSLYIRPTIIGTRASLGVAASDSALLYIILSPCGPYFPSGLKPIPLLAVGEHVRSWPGGTGGFKVGLNYAPTFQPQRVAAKRGYQQVLWLLGEDKRITEAGAMNFFVVVQREDGGMDVITPPLDGTILPGITRASVLALAAAHPDRTSLPNLPNSLRLHTHERLTTLADLIRWTTEGRLREAFTVGTAVTIGPVDRIGHDGGKDIVLPDYGGGLGPVGAALLERIVDIQTGRVEWQGWSVPCQ